MQNESLLRFLNFRPDICSEFPPPRHFLRRFRASFRGRQRPEKIHPKSPPLFNAKFPGKFEEKIRKKRAQSNTFFSQLPSSRKFSRSRKMFMELISLCKCNFLSFHNYFLQMQVGVLPELIILSKLSCKCLLRLFQDFGVPRQGCAIAERIRWEILPWKIEVIESVLSGLCR